MPKLAEDYVPAVVSARFRRRALRVWFIAAAVVLIWVMLILLAPAVRAGGAENFASPLYTFFNYICHQMPERSLFVFGEPFGVCSRCFGVYFGLLAGILAYPLWHPIDDIEPLSRVWLILSLIPIGVDWSLTFFGIWENTDLSRFISGGILGFACAAFIVPALIEIARNSMIKRRGVRIVD